jgi:hypothetical protein
VRWQCSVTEPVVTGFVPVSTAQVSAADGRSECSATRRNHGSRGVTSTLPVTRGTLQRVFTLLQKRSFFSNSCSHRHNGCFLVTCVHTIALVAAAEF